MNSRAHHLRRGARRGPRRSSAHAPQSKPERPSPPSAKRTAGAPWRGACTTSAHGLRLGALGLQELEARGRGGEQVAHLDPRADGWAAGRDRMLARPDRRGCDGPALAPAGATRCRGGRPRRWRAAPRRESPACAMRDEVAVGQLGGGVALHRQRQILGVHAAAVVDDADQPAAAVLDDDLDPARAGVERVLDQLLDGGRPAAPPPRRRRCGRRARDRGGESAWRDGCENRAATARRPYAPRRPITNAPDMRRRLREAASATVAVRRQHSYIT